MRYEEVKQAGHRRIDGDQFAIKQGMVVGRSSPELVLEREFWCRNDDVYIFDPSVEEVRWDYALPGNALAWFAVRCRAHCQAVNPRHPLQFRTTDFVAPDSSAAIARAVVEGTDPVSFQVGRGLGAEDEDRLRALIPKEDALAGQRTRELEKAVLDALNMALDMETLPQAGESVVLGAEDEALRQAFERNYLSPSELRALNSAILVSQHWEHLRGARPGRPTIELDRVPLSTIRMESMGGRLGAYLREQAEKLEAEVGQRIRAHPAFVACAKSLDEYVNLAGKTTFTREELSTMLRSHARFRLNIDRALTEVQTSFSVPMLGGVFELTITVLDAALLPNGVAEVKEAERRMEARDKEEFARLNAVLEQVRHLDPDVQEKIVGEVLRTSGMGNGI